MTPLIVSQAAHALPLRAPRKSFDFAKRPSILLFSTLWAAFCSAVCVAATPTAETVADLRVSPALKHFARRCADLPSLLNLPTTTVIQSTEFVVGGAPLSKFPDAGPEPAHCVVTGIIDPYTGVPDAITGNDQYGVQFELRLPVQWNGRFFYQGGGAADGKVFPAYGLITSQAGSFLGLEEAIPMPQTPGLWRGYAVATTDAGHHSNSMLAGFGVDPTARINYGYAAIGKVTSTAKQIIASYFGAGPQKSYFVGCSKGGQEALQAAQRYGDEFDGVVAGDPGFHLPHAAIAEAWNTQALATAAHIQAPHAHDSQGNPLLNKAFSPADLDLIRTRITAACDGLDGLKDNMIFNSQACLSTFKLASLQCQKPHQTQCLTPDQIQAAEKIFGGAKDSQGKALYPGFMYDTGIASDGGWPMWNTGYPVPGTNTAFNTSLGAGASRYVFTTPPDPALSMFTISMDAYASAIEATSGSYDVPAVGFMDADSTDLSALTSHGGKLLIYHGGSDPIFSPLDTIQYLENLKNQYGNSADSFVRLFLVPGMNHCVSGQYTTDTFDSLDAIVNWVEHQQAPNTLIAHPGIQALSKLPAGITRPLCPYPKYAAYQGGDPNQAQSFACVNPN